MGDRYELNLHCAYCNVLNFEIWYAPTCGSYTFICANCKKTNFVKDFKAVKIENITGEDFYDAFMDETNVYWNEDDIERIREECIDRANKLKHMNRVVL